MRTTSFWYLCVKRRLLCWMTRRATQIWLAGNFKDTRIYENRNILVFTERSIWAPTKIYLSTAIRKKSFSINIWWKPTPTIVLGKGFELPHANWPPLPSIIWNGDDDEGWCVWVFKWPPAKEPGMWNEPEKFQWWYAHDRMDTNAEHWLSPRRDIYIDEVVVWRWQRGIYVCEWWGQHVKMKC